MSNDVPLQATYGVEFHETLSDWWGGLKHGVSQVYQWVGWFEYWQESYDILVEPFQFLPPPPPHHHWGGVRQEEDLGINKHGTNKI